MPSIIADTGIECVSELLETIPPISSTGLVKQVDVAPVPKQTLLSERIVGKSMPTRIADTGADAIIELSTMIPTAYRTGPAKHGEPVLIPLEKSDAAKTIGGADYSMKLTDFLNEICPGFTLPDMFSELKDQTVGTLNLLIKLVKELYEVGKDHFADLGAAIIHVLNFYIQFKNTKNWTELSVGFVSMCLSLFKLDALKHASRHIQRIVGIYFEDLKKYFLKSESCEGGVKSFWSDITVTNPRTLFGMVHAASGIFTSILVLKSFVDTTFSDGDITKVITEVSTGIFQIGSEVRQHAQNITIFLARVYDWIYMNAEAIMKLQFDKIRWELPSDQVFESKYLELLNVINCYVSDPLYLEENNLSLEIIRNRLNKLRESGELELNKGPSPAVKGAITRYLKTLDDKILFIECALHPDNTKPQPMSVTLIGSAGCGKSTASDKIGLLMQAIAGRVPDACLIKNRGGDPKFEENITNSTDVIVYDDYANDQSVKLETKSILDIVNTTKEIIPKAAVDEKAKHKYSNVGTIFTTNDEDIGINCFRTASVDSLLRRLGICVFLAIKEKYQDHDSGRLNLNHPEVVDAPFNTDVYEVKIKLPICIKTENNNHPKVVYKDIEIPHTHGNNNWVDAVQQIQEMMYTHWTQANERHDRSKDVSLLCPSCSLPPDMCLCKLLARKCPPAPTDQKGLTKPIGITAEAMSKSRNRATSAFFKQPVATAQQKFLALDASFLDFSSFLAAKVSLFVYYKNIALYAKERIHFYCENYIALLSLLFILCMIPFGPVILIGAIVSYEYRYISVARQDKFEYDLKLGQAIVESKKARYSIYGATFITGALSLTAVFSALITISKVVLKSEDKVEEHPAIIEDVPVAPSEKFTFTTPKEKSNSDAVGYYLTKPRPAHQALSATKAEALAQIAKGISELTISTNESVSTVKCLPFGSERLIPKHALAIKGTMDIIVTQSQASSAYKNMDVPMSHVSNLQKVQLLRTKVLDAALVHLPNVPPGKDFSKYLAESGTLPTQAGCTYIHKDCSTGKYEFIGVRAHLLPKPISYTTTHGVETQYVYECEAQNHTSSDGDCGQPLVYNNSIIGIHIAGDSTKKWYCLAIDRSTVERANRILKQEASIFVASTPAEPVLKNNMKDLHFVDTPNTYVNDTLSTEHTPIVSLGSVLDANLQPYRARAEDYYFRNINEQIDVEFGIAKSRPPKYVNGVTQINTTLEKFNTPKMDVPIALMDRAVTDYVRGKTSDGRSVAGIANALQKKTPGFFAVRSLQEALDGDNTGVVRGMNNQTSSGICYGGKKTKHMKLDELDSPLIPRELNDYIEYDINHLDNEWRSGRGTFDPFVRASKTNEVLPLKKAYEKTRSIYGNDMSFFIAATRGIIPLKHVLRQMDVSECYVGLAAQSSQWADLHDYVTCGGKYTKFVCGDFSGYDTQLPKALLEKSAAVILQLYRENGASESDIEYLRGFLSSVVSPAMIWEGQLLQFCSGQPSGQPLTVEMNSMVNSFLCRMAFFTIMDKEYPEFIDPNFRDFVRLADYGDDNLMGVDDRIPLFNHTSIQAVFASWGIKYTMAEKEADSVPFQTIDEVSFLKRSFRFHPELNAIVAPIEEESLSKKFYWWTRQKNTPLTFPEQFGANYESQVREAYLHGTEFYEEFCAKCERIVAATATQPEDFVISWENIQVISSKRMNSMLIDAYHPELCSQDEVLHLKAESCVIIHPKVEEDPPTEPLTPKQIKKAARKAMLLTETPEEKRARKANSTAKRAELILARKIKRANYKCFPIEEIDQISQFLELLRIPSTQTRRKDTNITIANYGEIDLVLTIEDVTLVVEVKGSTLPSIVAKGRSQASRYAKVFEALLPDNQVFGLLYTPLGVQVISDNRKFHVCAVFDDFFYALGYPYVELQNDPV